MGDDSPIPPLSRSAPSLYAYFRQRFAQVTNPPIDPLRETLVMSLRMHLGRRGSLLSDRPSVGWRAAAGGAGGGGGSSGTSTRSCSRTRWRHCGGEASPDPRTL